MDSISYTKKHKGDFGASRNDSGWVGNDPLAKEVQEQEDVTYQNASTSPQTRDDETTSVSTDLWESSSGLGGVHNGAATPSSLFSQNTVRRVGNSQIDDCISPRTIFHARNPLSIPNEVHTIANVKELVARQRQASLQLLQSHGKGEAGGATLGISHNDRCAEDLDMRIEDPHTTVCVEEFHWHRDRPSRLLSYQGYSSSSSGKDDDDASSGPFSREPDSDGSEAEGWMMAESDSIPASFGSREGSQGMMVQEASLHRIDSQKSRKFVKKKKKGKRRSEGTARTSVESIHEDKQARPARPLRHYSYGATLDLPPMGIQTHRDTLECKAGNDEAAHEAELIMSQDATQLEAQSQARDEPLSMVRKWIIGILLLIPNVVLLGSALACILWSPIWNESRFAVGSIF